MKRKSVFLTCMLVGWVAWAAPAVTGFQETSDNPVKTARAFTVQSAAQEVEWEYEISQGDYAIVTGATPAKGDLEIPSELGGVPVREIADSAFEWCSSLTRVTIPSSVTRIGADEFDSNCRIWRSSTIAYTNLRGAENTNPATYEEGKGLAFVAPGAVTGYTFTGWTPAQITAEMTGAQTVQANWNANTYRIAYSANGGTGHMDETACQYDAEGPIATNAFVREGYIFMGWATKEGGPVVYAPGEKVKNLTSNAGGVVQLYAVWEAEHVETPVIEPANGTIFKTASCRVTIACATKDAVIYYTTNGRTPRPIKQNRYTGPFDIAGTTTILAYAVNGKKKSELMEATLTNVEPEPLTLATALDEKKLQNISIGGDAAWYPVEDGTAKIGDSVVRSGVIGTNQTSWLEATVQGKGTLAFWWKVSCEPDPYGRYSYDHVTFTADGEEKAKLDGETDWQQVSVSFETDGTHTIRWTYSSDDYDAEGYQDCAWIDGVTWTGSAAPTQPSVSEDAGAKVEETDGKYIVTPSAGNTNVVVEIPAGVDAKNVTVKVSPDVKSVKANGATVRVVRNGHDITRFLNIPGPNADGVLDLTQATVKDKVAKEILDTAKGAKINLTAANPSITTANTKPGLRYQLYEGTSLGVLGRSGDPKEGDGEAWTPTLTVKGGPSGFYSIHVEIHEKK